MFAHTIIILTTAHLISVLTENPKINEHTGKQFAPKKQDILDKSAEMRKARALRLGLIEKAEDFDANKDYNFPATIRIPQDPNAPQKPIDKKTPVNTGVDKAVPDTTKEKTKDTKEDKKDATNDASKKEEENTKSTTDEKPKNKAEKSKEKDGFGARLKDNWYYVVGACVLVLIVGCGIVFFIIKNKQ